MLIDTRARATVSWYWDADCYYLQSYGSYGAMTPTLEYVNLFPYADGTPFDASFWDRQSKDHYIAEDPFANRDPRLYENCLVNNAEFGMDHVAELWLVDVRVLPMTLPVMVRHLRLCRLQIHFG